MSTTAQPMALPKPTSTEVAEEELWAIYDNIPKVRCTPYDTETMMAVLPTVALPLSDHMEFVWEIESHTHVDVALVEHKVSSWYTLEQPSCYRSGDTLRLHLRKVDLP